MHMHTAITDKRNYVLPASWSLIESSLSVVDEGDIVTGIVVDGITDGGVDGVDWIDGGIVSDGDINVDVDDVDDVGRSNVTIIEYMQSNYIIFTIFNYNGEVLSVIVPITVVNISLNSVTPWFHSNAMILYFQSLC